MAALLSTQFFVFVWTLQIVEPCFNSRSQGDNVLFTCFVTIRLSVIFNDLCNVFAIRECLFMAASISNHPWITGMGFYKTLDSLHKNLDLISSAIPSSFAIRPGWLIWPEENSRRINFVQGLASHRQVPADVFILFPFFFLLFFFVWCSWEQPYKSFMFCISKGSHENSMIHCKKAFPSCVFPPPSQTLKNRPFFYYIYIKNKLTQFYKLEWTPSEILPSWIGYFFEVRI